MLQTLGWRRVAGGLVLAGVLALGTGCSTPQEREIERLNDEIRSYLANDEDQRDALREDYADAREVVEARRDVEVAEKRTTALIEARARRRNTQLQDLEAELAAKESDLDQKKTRFVEERHWAIQPAGSYTAPTASYDAPATWHIAPGALNSTTAVEEIVR